MWSIISVLFFFLYGSAPSAPQPRSWDAKSIAWQAVYNDGVKFAILEGSREIYGKPFTYALFLPAGYWEHRWNSTDSRIVIISGELSVSFGSTLDKKRAKRYAAGTFLIVPARVRHTIGAEVDTILIATAPGPWSSHTDDGQTHDLK